MNLQQRIDLLSRLGEYLKNDAGEWQAAKERASRENSWFIPEFLELATTKIADSFLHKDKLRSWSQSYDIPEENTSPKKIGIVMAGNIPLVGFHDFLCV